MKVLIPDGGTIVIGGILDSAGSILEVFFEIVRILIGLLLPAIQA
ncbi:MAG: hypothetical protein AMXMBFR82_05420 [Candidatus Hydrogenedentota bacterium]